MQNDSKDVSASLKERDTENERQRRCFCPECQSENTQKIEMAFLSGRFKGTPLEAEIRPPKEPQLIPTWLILIFAIGPVTFAWWYGTRFPAAPWTQEFGTWLNQVSGQEFLTFLARIFGFGIGGVLLGYWLFSSDLKMKQLKIKLSHDYRLAKENWNYGFICHKCGHRFLVRPQPKHHVPETQVL